MRGEIIAAWGYLWDDVWMPLLANHEFPSDLFCELYRALAPALKQQMRPEVLADILDDPIQAEQTFRSITFSELAGERTVVMFLEDAFEVLEEMSGDGLSNDYFNLLDAFLSKFSLRYDLRRPCVLCPTIAGVFANLVRDVRVATSGDQFLDGLMKDFEESVRDLRGNATDSRIRTVMVKQINLLEALGSRYPGVTEQTVGKICGQVDTWPHKKVKEAMQCLYTFTCNYPGIRHAGDPQSALRDIDMRDLVSMSILLTGFLPYFTDQIDPDVVYRGA